MDWIQRSGSRVVRMILALGYAAMSSEAKLAHGQSVTAVKYCQNFVLDFDNGEGIHRNSPTVYRILLCRRTYRCRTFLLILRLSNCCSDLERF